MKSSYPMPMVKSSNTTKRIATPLIAASLGLGGSAWAGIDLDKLTACEEISKLQVALTAAIGAKPRNCRAPKGVLEHALVKRSRLGANKLCFQASPPTPSLRDFSCLIPEVPTGATLVCFRDASLTDVRQYQEQYGETFAPLVSRYLASASKCSASNGDSSSATTTAFPPLLTFIARFDFGFISLLGKERHTDSSVIHGYGATDPSIGGGAPSAIEFFNLFVGAAKYIRAGERKSVGTWIAHIDDNATGDRSANEEFRKRRAPLMIDMTNYSLERRTTATLAHSAKLALLEGFQRAIASTLEDEGFELVSDDKLKEKSGRTSEETIAEISRNMAFGARDMPVKPGPVLLIMVNERHPQCARSGNGAMAAYLMSTQPVPEVRSDYGSVGLILAGMGACSRPSNPITRTYVNGLIDAANDELLKALERH